MVRSSNIVGLSEADLAALPAPELAARLDAARAALTAAGAHIVIDTVADLPAALDALPIAA